MAAKRKDPTWTSLVLGALRKQDDFMDNAMLRAITGGNSNQVSAALIHLRKFRAVDVVVNPDGRGWWFALPPAQDARSTVHGERTPESKPRKPRQPRKAAVIKA